MSTDEDFKDWECGTCGKESIGKSMSRCGECEDWICQNCPSKYNGCKFDDLAFVCKGCFDEMERQYCDDEDCQCGNPSPLNKMRSEQFKALLEEAYERRGPSVVFFDGKHKLRKVRDLYLSDRPDHSYIAWCARQEMADARKYQLKKTPHSPSLAEVNAIKWMQHWRPCIDEAQFILRTKKTADKFTGLVDECYTDFGEEFRKEGREDLERWMHRHPQFSSWLKQEEAIRLAESL